MSHQHLATGRCLKFLCCFKRGRSLLLEILQSLGLVYPKATVLLLPSVVRLLRHTDLLDCLGNGLASPHLDFDLSQLGDDLLGQFFLSAWY